jgi:4-aminobutyrate aminotransferase / (S)-3-amino-2-methylpropionate transaminase / 5-aminovalerate transaminase
MIGNKLPTLRTSIPGPLSQQWIDRLAVRECPAITARRSRRAAVLGLSKDDPIVWKKAIGSNVIDVDGNVFVDMTAGFGVASVGHRNPNVVEAVQTQAQTLLHAMGDAYPDPQRILLMEKLSKYTGLDRTIFGCSGSDSVEAAIKTARIATGRHRILAFDNSYHGLAFGSLSITDYKSSAFRRPFEEQLGTHVDHAIFNEEVSEDLSQYAAVIVEPIQGRGGIRPAQEEWLSSLIKQAHAAGTLVIFDEIYTGFGRTGDWFAFQHESLRGEKPDILCIGKALAGGFPISACIGSATVMDTWGASQGEAIHTQTFLGNPLGCAMALAALTSLEKIIPSVNPKSKYLCNLLHSKGFTVRGRGLLLGIELDDSLSVSRSLLQKGYIALPAGPNCEVLALTPPLIITNEQLNHFVNTLTLVCA